MNRTGLQEISCKGRITSKINISSSQLQIITMKGADRPCVINSLSWSLACLESGAGTACTGGLARRNKCTMQGAIYLFILGKVICVQFKIYKYIYKIWKFWFNTQYFTVKIKQVNIWGTKKSKVQQQIR